MNVLDRMRGAYVAAPPWVRSAASSVLRFVPAGALYGGRYREWRGRIAHAREHPAAAEISARRALSEVMTSALRSSGFYRAAVGDLADRPVEPEQAFELLKRFPRLSKEEVRDQAARLAVVPLSALDCVTTSGSSGEPLKVYLDRDRGVRELAFIHEVWSRSGYEAGEPRGVFRGVHIDKVDENPMSWEPALKELRCSPFHLTDAHMATYAREIDRRSIRYLHGYPSALSIFARFLQRQEIGWRHAVRGVFPISEATTGDQWSTFSVAFPGAQILPFYGQTEKVAFGDPVESRPGWYAMNPLYGWTEVVDQSGRPVAAGETGSVLSTGFLSRGMPLIRYDTGDLAKVEALPSPTTGWRLIVSSLTSRWRQEFLVSEAGALLSMTALNIHSRNYLSMREFMFRQCEPGRATLMAVPAPNMSRQHVEAYLQELRAKTGSGISFDLELVDALPTAARGKRRFIDQKLDLTCYGA